MTRTPRLYILDMLESIKKILKYTADLKFEQFLENFAGKRCGFQKF
jgi:uncharacterized protein with HEPN domain